MLLFLLMAAKLYFREKYLPMALMLGISLVIKPFSVLIAVPVIVLIIRESGLIYMGLSAVMAAIPFILDKVLTAALWPKYYEMKAFTDEATKVLFGQTRLEGLFSVSLGNLSLFFAVVLVVCFICLYRSVENGSLMSDYAFYPAVIYTALAAFVSATYYWYIAVLPLFIILGLRMKSRWCLPFLLAGNSLGALFNMLINEGAYHVSLYYNLPGKLMGVPVPAVFYDGGFKMILVKAASTLFVVTMILFLVICKWEEDE